MRKLIFLLVILGLTFACKKEEKKVDENLIDRKFTAKMPVTTCESIQGTLTQYIYANGLIRSAKKARVILETSGKLEKLHISENQQVKAGDILAEIDVENLKLDLERLLVDIEKSQTELEALVAIEGNENRENISSRIGLKKLLIQKKQTELNIEKAKVVAPISGIISDLTLDLGEFVGSGSQLCKIYNLDKMYVDVPVLESEISNIELNKETFVQIASRKEPLYKGKIESISPKIDADSRSCNVRVSLQNDGFLKEGMYTDVKISAKDFSDKVIISKDALLVRDGKKLVFAVEDKKAKWKYVTTGVENNYFITIEKGIKSGEEVVIEGNFALSHDADVKVKESKDYEEISEVF